MYLNLSNDLLHIPPIWCLIYKRVYETTFHTICICQNVATAAKINRSKNIFKSNLRGVLKVRPGVVRIIYFILTNKCKLIIFFDTICRSHFST